MLTFDQIADLVSCVTYKPGWHIHLRADKARPYIQVEATTLDSQTLTSTKWKGAKHYLSYHMCRQEVIGTCHHAIERAELHEMNEFFRYKGAAIYNPHLDPDALVPVAKKISSYSLRENAMSMEETQYGN